MHDSDAAAVDRLGMDSGVIDAASPSEPRAAPRLALSSVALFAATGVGFLAGAEHHLWFFLTGLAAFLAAGIPALTPTRLPVPVQRWASPLAAASGAVGACLWMAAELPPLAVAGVAAVFIALALYTSVRSAAFDASVAAAAWAAVAATAIMTGVPASAVLQASALFLALSVVVGLFALRIRALAEQLAHSRGELDSLINMDRLTGLNNRAAFDTYLNRVWRQSRRCQDNLSILIVDIDFFSEFNERYGQPEGDRCVQRVAGVLSNLGKRPLDYVARFDGSSFALILYDPVTSYIRKLVAEIQASIVGLHIPNERSPLGPRLTVSIGAVVLGPHSDKTVSGALEFAEHAVAGAKLRGRDRAVICESSDLRATETDLPVDASQVH